MSEQKILIIRENTSHTAKYEDMIRRAGQGLPVQKHYSYDVAYSAEEAKNKAAVHRYCIIFIAIRPFIEDDLILVKEIKGICRRAKNSAASIVGISEYRIKPQLMQEYRINAVLLNNGFLRREHFVAVLKKLCLMPKKIRNAKRFLNPSNDINSRP